MTQALSKFAKQSLTIPVFNQLPVRSDVNMGASVQYAGTHSDFIQPTCKVFNNKNNDFGTRLLPGFTLFIQFGCCEILLSQLDQADTSYLLDGSADGPERIQGSSAWLW